MNVVDYLFWAFSLLTLGGAIAMIFSRHPVSAAMFMIVSLVGVAALFVLLDAFFLAVLQVLVYAGAVMVLFLFIIMLLDVGPGGGSKKLSHLKTGVFGGVGVLFLFGVLVALLDPGGWCGLDSDLWPELSASDSLKSSQLSFSTEISSFGYGLLTKYMLPLQVCGFMLLASMVGVIILSKRKPEEEV